MSAVDSAIVFLPRPTTLAGAATFTSTPLDVSRWGSMQIQVWRGPIRGGGSYLAYLEESADTEVWTLGPSAPEGFDPADGETGGDPSFARPQFFSYAFRLRWFRLRVVLAAAGGATAPQGPVVTTWAEGFLRDGGGGPGTWTPARPKPVRGVNADIRLPPPLVSETELTMAKAIHGVQHEASPTPPATLPGMPSGPG